MGTHDYYVKNLLRSMLGSRYKTEKEYTLVKFAEGTAQIDGVISFPEGEIAVEIESRTAKQVRGAIVDLFFHKARKKLLIIVPEHMYNPETLKKDAEYIMNTLKILRPEIEFMAVILKGSGKEPRRDEDLKILEEAIIRLRRR